MPVVVVAMASAEGLAVGGSFGTSNPQTVLQAAGLREPPPDSTKPVVLSFTSARGEPQSAAAAPLLHDGTAVGLLLAVSPDSDHWTAERLALLVSAAHLGGGLGGVTLDAARDEDIQTSEAALRTLLGAMQDVILVLDETGRYLQVAPSGVRRLIRPSHELVGRRLHDVFPKATADRFVGYIRRALELNEPVEVEYALTIHGESVWFSTTVSPMPSREVLWVARDVTERRQAELARSAAETRFRSLVEQSIAGIYIIQDGRFTYVNPKLAEIFGYTVDEMLQLPSFAAVVAPESRNDVTEQIRRRIERESETAHYTFKAVRKDGTVLDVEAYGTGADLEGHRAVIGMLLDVTERSHAAEALRRSEVQLRQAQKMEAIGQLAGGIAHDFNNLLASIAINCAFLDELIGQNEGHEEIEEIRTGIERAALLTRQLLAFSRRQVLQPKPLDFGQVLEDTQQLLHRLIGEDIRLVIDASEEPITVVADRSQLEQVMMNLAVNARDAMPEGGTLTIRSRLITVPDPKANAPALLPGTYLCLQITDTGGGIPQEDHARIFEPFFTTKEPGKGTGLGLSVVHGIVKQSGGAISVTSAPDAGATFTIWLPCQAESQ
ncbi:MAG TPA: PAS domain S-box protein, partial [Gemmatimonadales bacterium]|nr:PAS domain S-box protein [Gemmatimonadales bacterium]